MAFGGALVGSAKVLLGVEDSRFQADLQRNQRQFRRATREMEGDAQRMGRGMLAASGALGGLSRTVAFASGAFLGGAGLAMAARTAFREMADGERVAVQVNAVLRSTGGIAGVTAKGVDELATSLMRKTGIDDEAIKSGEALLLTFTNIRNVAGEGNDVFNQSTRAILDMSVALDEDLKSSAIRLGKALQDPISGVTALRRVGVAFTEQQRDKIKSLVEENRVLDAQRLILAELNIEFGGSAEAAGKNMGGLARLRETAINLAGAYATTLKPEIEEFVGWLQEQADELEKNKQLQQDVRDTVVKLAEGLREAAGYAKDLAEAAGDVAEAVGGWDDAFRLVLSGAIAVRLARILGLLGGPRGDGKGGIVGMMTRLKGLGPGSLVVALSGSNKVGDKYRAIAQDARARQLEEDFGVGSRPDEGSRGVGSGLQLPMWGGKGADVYGNHHSGGMTTGLEEWGPTAHDFMQRAGTAVLAPEDGFVKSARPFNGKNPGFWGAAIYYQGTQTGALYYVKHIMANHAPVGSSHERGDVIAFVAHGTQGGDHAHVGVKEPDGQAAAPTSGLSPDKDKKKKSAKDKVDDLIPPRLQLAVAEAELTKTTADDLRALAQVERYLEQRIAKTRDIRKKTDLVEALASTRGKIAGLQPEEPAYKPPVIPGLAGVQRLFEAAAGGRVQTAAQLPGVGKILFSFAPTIADWKRVLTQLTAKLKAAVARRDAVAKSLKRAQRAKFKNKAHISKLKRDLAHHNQSIVELRQQIGDSILAIKELSDEANSAIQRAADEAEQLAADAAAQAQDAADDLPTDVRLALAQAEGTESTADDLSALGRAESVLQARLDAGQVVTAAGTFALTDEARIAVTQQLNSIRAEIKRITEQAAKSTAKDVAGAVLPGPEELQRALNERVGFLSGLRNLRSFQDNVLNQLGALNGSTIHVSNYFSQGPPDEHLFVKGLELELKALVG